ncbi:MAG TPA: two-component regulator propeller domain-containing protein, partial [Blastocatellia bacterium]|nr:two-component regulator propeller domain-containing protein [Blastocatellia bacterium]
MFVLAIFSSLSSISNAQRLPFHSYGIRDGLADARVTAIYQDRKGYLWFGTWEGLSRFDGYSFKNYGLRDGLSNTIINGITEDRLGNLWVATNIGGVARLIDDPNKAPKETPRKRFVSYHINDEPGSDSVNTLIFDKDNTLWCYKDNGIFRAATANIETAGLQFEQVVPPQSNSIDGSGSMLIDS